MLDFDFSLTSVKTVKSVKCLLKKFDSSFSASRRGIKWMREPENVLGV